MLIERLANESGIAFETIRRFSRVTDFCEYDGVTNDKTGRLKVLNRVT
jgi:hypothetical protein